MLYVQMPRVAFESERDKEQLLISRGEQFKRAIYLYVLANKRYPGRIEDLENTNDKRYLRKRYIDPYTGKNEWRLVHTNGMTLTDSLVQKPPANPNDPNNPNKDQTASNTPATPTTSTLPGGAPQPADVNATVLQRPSDRTLPTGVPGQGTPASLMAGNDPNQQYQNQQYQNPNYPPITLGPVGPNGQPLAQNGVQGFQGNYPGGAQPGLQPGVANSAFPANLQQLGIQPGGAPGAMPGQVPYPGSNNGQFPTTISDPAQLQALLQAQAQAQAQAQNQNGAAPPQGGGFNPGAGPGGFNPGGAAAGGQNNALGLINSLLTTPRQPPPGIGAPASNNNTLGAGIAEVAEHLYGSGD